MAASLPYTTFRAPSSTNSALKQQPEGMADKTRDNALSAYVLQFKSRGQAGTFLLYSATLSSKGVVNASGDALIQLTMA